MSTPGFTRPGATRAVFVIVLTLAVSWLLCGMAVGMFVLGYRFIR